MPLPQATKQHMMEKKNTYTASILVASEFEQVLYLLECGL
jgi:hypothetical protein